ncbi:protein crumbs-like [Athalia rosae]|uniref:protein crumbs-like n=1 Tax=Athalia rosae TaxID=37344 RepID=UPI000625E9A7|nr:protein crumbs-like [Athalia rosae]
MFTFYRAQLPLLLVLFTIIGTTLACELDQMHHGCRIASAKCSCGYGCRSEYRYNNIKECYRSLNGSRNDICYRRPCRHGGSCLQISQDPGFKCQCEGTGFYGPRCDNACPGPQNSLIHGPFPYECVVI